MNTPFEKRTWTVRHLTQKTICNTPEPDIDFERKVPSEFSKLNSIYVSRSPEQHPPLRSHSHFNIYIDENECVKIEFLDAPSYMIKIWEQAENVYFDREFNAIRGDLMYNKETGLPSSAFGHHFLIAYKGRMATGGTFRKLLINLYDEQDIVIPTRDLFYLCSRGASYDADDLRSN